MTLPKIYCYSHTMGCDPEFFFKVNHKIVGAELYLPKEGLKKTTHGIASWHPPETKPVLIIDGVQAELNPRPNTCRGNLGNEIAACFKTLRDELNKRTEKVEVDFSQSIKIDKKELARLDEKNQKFGCMPSKNSYNESGAKLAAVDATKYRNRSAGGHIHIGADTPEFKEMLKTNPEDIVMMLDIICGNICVLIDRDKGNVTRRKLYGRAGEYRLPVHGLEYRTLSNFWLQSSQLMSLVFGLTRLAVNLATHRTHGKEYIKAFKERVSSYDVQRAINSNNYTLAYRNWKAIKPLLKEVLAPNNDHVALDSLNLDLFEYFFKSVRKDGLKSWFPQDPMTHWTSIGDAHHHGFHTFLNFTVRSKMQAELNKAKVVA